MKGWEEIPKEIIGGRKGQSAIYVEVDKKLVTDIANQAKTPYTIISIDTSNYFNRVAHPMVALAYTHFRLENDYIETFFTTIQNMWIYLLTVYRISSTFYIGSEKLPFQGLI